MFFFDIGHMQRCTLSIVINRINSSTSTFYIPFDLAIRVHAKVQMYFQSCDESNLVDFLWCFSFEIEREREEFFPNRFKYRVLILIEAIFSSWRCTHWLLNTSGTATRVLGLEKLRWIAFKVAKSAVNEYEQAREHNLPEKRKRKNEQSKERWIFCNIKMFEFEHLSFRMQHQCVECYLERCSL